LPLGGIAADADGGNYFMKLNRSYYYESDYEFCQLHAAQISRSALVCNVYNVRYLSYKKIAATGGGGDAAKWQYSRVLFQHNLSYQTSVDVFVVPTRDNRQNTRKYIEI
jgi:hypothetical protein